MRCRARTRQTPTFSGAPVENAAAGWRSLSSCWKNAAGQHDAVHSHLLEEVRLEPGAGERREHRRDAAQVGLVGRGREEHVLQRDHVGLHAQHLGDVRHPPCAVDEPRLVDDEVEGARDLLADGAEWEVDARREHERLEAARGRRGGSWRGWS